MDLSIPRFAGLGDRPHQFHPPWSIASDSPASPVTGRLETSGEEDSRCSVDQMSVSSACLNLDLLSSSSEDDSKVSDGLSDLSITLFCDSEEARTPFNSDQVLSDGDFPEESVPKDKRQVVRRCASPPGGQIVGVARNDRECEPPSSGCRPRDGEVEAGESFQDSLPDTAHVRHDSCVYFRCAGGHFRYNSTSGHCGQ